MVLFLFAALFASSGFALENDVARTPPMGFNPWNNFGTKFDEQAAKETIDALIAKGLRDAGYVYFNLDGWATTYTTAPTPEWPSGMVAFSKFVHDKGFKFGVYGGGGDGFPKGAETQNAN